MASRNCLRTTRLVQVRRYSQLSVPRPILELSRNVARTYRGRLNERPRNHAVGGSALRSRLADTRYGSSATAESPAIAESEQATESPATVEVEHVTGSSAPAESSSVTTTTPPESTASLEPEYRYWKHAHPQTLTKWEHLMIDVYGPNYKERLTYSELQLLDRIEARREVVTTKLRELIGDNAVEQLRVEREKLNAENPRKKAKTPLEQWAAWKDAPQSRFIEHLTEELQVKAMDFIKLLLLLSRMSLGRQRAVALARISFELGGKQRIFTPTRFDPYSVPRFSKSLRSKILGIPESERTAEKLAVVLQQTQQESLVEAAVSMTEEQLEEFRARLKEGKVQNL